MTTFFPVLSADKTLAVCCHTLDRFFGLIDRLVDRLIHPLIHTILRLLLGAVGCAVDQTFQETPRVPFCLP
jgi:hypothetical protein